MQVVTIPNYLDDRTFEQVADRIGTWPPEGRLLFDARGTLWASPYGFTTLLTAAQAIHEAKLERPRLALPDKEDVRSYWAKAGFLQHAAEWFELHGRVPRRQPDTASDVLLPITPLRGSDDVHGVVSGIQEGSARILGELGIPAKATMRFAMTLSEACQNVIEHAGTGGWVAVHAYTFRKRLGRRAVVIAVSDAGVGFRRSLEATEAKRHGNRWNDRVALESALIHGVSRFRDPGRGQGFAGIKHYMQDWLGKVSIRSGTARLAIVPAWDDDLPMAEGLAFFPGAQVQIVVPAQEAPA